jgi:hypothetical protein
VKDQAIVKVLRQYTQHRSPRVRAAAEAGLRRMFGAALEKKRDIAPPVQPPRKDD